MAIPPYPTTIPPSPSCGTTQQQALERLDAFGDLQGAEVLQLLPGCEVGGVVAPGDGLMDGMGWDWMGFGEKIEGDIMGYQWWDDGMMGWWGLEIAWGLGRRLGRRSEWIFEVLRVQIPENWRRTQQCVEDRGSDFTWFYHWTLVSQFWPISCHIFIEFSWI